MTLGILCLIVGLMPYWQVATKSLVDGPTETTRTFTLGVPISPLLFVETSETTGARVGGGVVTGNGLRWSIAFASWSMLSIVFGVLLCAAATRWCKALQRKHEGVDVAL
jgi:hypothetical protein